MIRLLALVLLLAAPPAAADEIRCAVASNFVDCLEQIARAFEDSTGHTVVLSPGSTGSHYAQIRQGAPFDLFFAADTERPRRLEAEGFAVAGTRTTYARGALVLWTRTAASGAGPDDPREVLGDPALRRLAVADPRLAPYGRAARQVLERLDLDFTGRLVTGRNVAQAWQFAFTGAVDAALVSAAQAALRSPPAGRKYAIPAAWHDPVDQQAVVLATGRRGAAAALLAFATGPVGRDLVQARGYLLPEEAP